MEHRYRNLINSMNDAVFVCPINYGQTLGNFVEVNDAACRLLGYTRDELFRLNPLPVLFGNSDAQITGLVDRLYTEGNIILDTTHTTAAGTAVAAEISAHICEFNNRPAVLAISRDVSARRKVEEKLRLRTQQLRNLASRLQSAREQERAAIAREIHDELGQSLTVLKIQVALLAGKLRTDQQDLHERAQTILSMIDGTVETVQRISMQLRPPILDELGLTAALDWQAKDFSKRTGIACELEAPETEMITDREMAAAVFRIVQEALTNAARHANASRVKILLRESAGTALLSVCDNGKGITASQTADPHSLGLLGMKERALVFGGSVEIKSSMNSGTLVLVSIPLQHNAKTAATAAVTLPENGQ